MHGSSFCAESRAELCGTEFLVLPGDLGIRGCFKTLPAPVIGWLMSYGGQDMHTDGSEFLLVLPGPMRILDNFWVPGHYSYGCFLGGC